MITVRPDPRCKANCEVAVVFHDSVTFTTVYPAPYWVEFRGRAGMLRLWIALGRMLGLGRRCPQCDRKWGA